MHDQRFGDLRSLLQLPPSDEVWAALCQQLDLWPAEPLESLAIPYALEHLARWPAALRCDAPPRWVDALLRGQPCPQLVCARALTATIHIDLLEDTPLSFNTPSFEIFGDPFPTARHQRLFDTPLLRNVRELTLAPRKLDAAALGAWLGGARHLDALHALAIVSEQLNDDHLDALAASPSLARLTRLALCQGYAITTRGALALAASPYISSLTSLDLSYAKIGDEGARALAASPYLTRLTSLDLTANLIDAAGAAALASSPHLAAVQTLWLPHNPINATSAAALLRLPALSALSLVGCDIEADALDALAQQAASRGVILQLGERPTSWAGWRSRRARG